MAQPYGLQIAKFADGMMLYGRTARAKIVTLSAWSLQSG